jgi:hypothetical protein
VTQDLQFLLLKLHLHLLLLLFDIQEMYYYHDLKLIHLITLSWTSWFHLPVPTAFPPHYKVHLLHPLIHQVFQLHY